MENFEYIGSEKMIPEEFEVIGYGYRMPIMGMDGRIEDWEAEIDVDGIDDDVCDTLVEMVHSKTQCNHCNTHIRYLVVCKHESGSIHVLGSECGADLKNFTMSKVDAMKDKALRFRKKQKRENDRKQFLHDNPGLEKALEGDHNILRDLKSKFREYTKLSEKQVELAFKLEKQVKEWAEKKAEQNKNAKPVEEGRLQKIEMEVVSTKEKQPSGMWDEGVKVAMLLLHPDGFRVWGKIGYDTELLELDKGSKILFSGTVTKSSDDEFFGFFKRGIVHEVTKVIKAN